MTHSLLVATTQGFTVAERNGQDWRVVERSLMDKQVTSVIAREGVILAGTTDGIYRSSDLGQTWTEASQGLDVRHIRWLAFHPNIADAEFAGTEPAGIFVSRNGGESWRSCPEIATLRDANGWFLPYSPEAGCVRGFAFHGQRAYAAVEVGGALRSDDGGDTWRLTDGCTGDPDFGKPTPPGFVHTDVHSIEVHPSSADIIFAATNGGLHRSLDGGAVWTNLYPNHYCRAVWIDPYDVNHIILGPANSVDQYGRIEESVDGGKTWHMASDGLDAPWPRMMVERFAQKGDDLFAVLSNGQLFTMPLADMHWRRILSDVAGVAGVTWMA